MTTPLIVIEGAEIASVKKGILWTPKNLLDYLKRFLRMSRIK